jgi:cobalt-zinc-cadmium efflux system protein
LPRNVKVDRTRLKIKKLKIVLVLLCSYLVVEVVAGYITGSLAILADASHMLADVFGIGLVLFATLYSKKPATPLHTYGFYRTEILSSLTNSVILLFISTFIIFEAYRRIFSPHEIQSFNMLVVAIVGLLVNLVGFILLKEEHSPQSSSAVNTISDHFDHFQKIDGLHMQSARLELLSDMLGSFAIIISAIVIVFTNFWVIDSIASFGLALFIIPRTWHILKRSVVVLMESSPSNLPYDEIKKSILEIKGVTGIFDLHIWSITSGINALSAHVIVMDLNRSHVILQDINSLLDTKFKITHTTIQIEKYHHTINDEKR